MMDRTRWDTNDLEQAIRWARMGRVVYLGGVAFELIDREAGAAGDAQSRYLSLFPNEDAAEEFLSKVLFHDDTPIPPALHQGRSSPAFWDCLIELHYRWLADGYEPDLDAYRWLAERYPDDDCENCGSDLHLNCNPHTGKILA